MKNRWHLHWVRLGLAAAIAMLLLWAQGLYRSGGFTLTLGGMIGFIGVTVGMYITSPWLFPLRKRETVLIGLFALLLALSYAFGRMLTLYDALFPTAQTAVVFAVETVGFTPFIGWLLALAYRLTGGAAEGKRPGAQVKPARVFMLAFGVLMACWLPVYLAFYPGIYAYDVNSQAAQCFTGLYDTRNPLWHTLYLKLCFLLGGALGSYTAGVGIGLFVQMTLAAAGLAYALCILSDLGVSLGKCLILLAFYALFPVFPILSISFIKDALFAISFLLSLLLLYRLTLCLSKGEKWHGDAVRFGVLMALSMIMRYNAILAYGFGLAGCLLGVAHLRKKVFVGICVGAVMVAVLCNMALAGLLNASSRTGKYEMFSIVAQQLRRAQRVAANAEDSEAIASCFLASVPADQAYNPTFGDIARFSLNTTVYDWNDTAVDIPVNPDYIMKVWLRMAVRYPQAYVEAFLQTNRGSWYVDDLSHAEIYGPPGNGVGYLVTTFNDTSQWYAVQRHSLFPALAQALSHFVCDNAYQRIPILSQFMGTGFQVWLFLGGMLLCVLHRRRVLFCICLLPFGIWLTILAGPCTLVRYLYPLYLFNPMLLALLAKPQTDGRLAL